MGVVSDTRPADVPLSLEDKYTLAEGRIFLTGVQALVRVPMDQHRRDAAAGLRTATLLSGYPGSPLGGYDAELARRRELLDRHHMVHQPAVNEELAATAVMGSQLVNRLSGRRYDGVLGVWYGKAPGLDRAGDAVKHGNYIGADRHGGVLLLVGDDPSCKSSTLPSHSEVALYDALMPILYPADVQDVLDLGLHGFALSRASGLWTGVKVATGVADGSGTAEVGPARVLAVVPEVELDGRPFRHVVNAHMLSPVSLPAERAIHEARLEVARRYCHENALNRIERRSDADQVGIVAAGKTYLDVRQALARLGLRDAPVRLLRIGMLFPLDGRVVREFARGLREVIVVEEKRPFLETAIKDALYAVSERPRVVGKRDERDRPLLPAHGELDVDAVARALAARLPVGDEVRASLEPRPDGWAPLPVTRTPYFCSGCPHNRSTAVPAGSVLGSGIGCHTMALLMSPGQVGEYTGVTQMGGEGCQWIGMAPFTDTAHFIQNLGDGTLFHSGSLAIRAAVAAGADITFKILYNGGVAMTGGQHAPGSVPVPRLTEQLAAEGVRRTIVSTEDPDRYRGVRLAPGASVVHRDRLVEAQEELARTAGVTVLIHDGECAAEKRRRRKRGTLADPAVRAFIDERVCEGCGDCARRSNCLSVQPVSTEFGEKTRIHQASCNKDYSCLDGDCPAFLRVVPAPGRARRPTAPPLDGDALPAPEPRAAAGDFAMRVMGIGGTGVVTVAQVLGVAALLDGLLVRGLDQTGLAQKGGPVVSDLKLSAAPVERASKLAAGECDLYLAADVLVAAEPRNLAVADPRRTVAVLSTAEVPTGHMVVDQGLRFTSGPLLERIEASMRAAHRLDAVALSGTLLGSELAANMLLVGAAHQAGALPLSAGSIERAIELNGTAVALNVQAFRRGRQAVCDPQGLAEAVRALRPRAPEPPPLSEAERAIVDGAGAPGEELERLLSVRVPELVRYQDERYARGYAAFVAEVAAAERAAAPGHTEIAEAVARNLYKLMAYKDEYEVARLHLDPGARRRIEAEFGPGARAAWQLRPPALRALGLGRKLDLGPWFEPGLRALRAGRRVRGTALDPFGRTAVRRIERALPGEYRAMVRRALAHLSPSTHAQVLELAGLPDAVRGYEEIKLAAVARYRERAAALLARLGALESG